MARAGCFLSRSLQRISVYLLENRFGSGRANGRGWGGLVVVGALRNGCGTPARLRWVAMQASIELLNFRFQLRNFLVKRSLAIGNGIGFFSEPCHDGGYQRRKSTRSKAAPTSNATTAMGQVNASPRRQSWPK